MSDMIACCSGDLLPLKWLYMVTGTEDGYQ